MTTKKEEELAAIRAIMKLEGKFPSDVSKYTNEKSGDYAEMVEQVRKDFNFTSLRYQYLDDMVEAVSLPKEKLCNYCWTGEGT